MCIQGYKCYSYSVTVISCYILIHNRVNRAFRRRPGVAPDGDAVADSAHTHTRDSGIRVRVVAAAQGAARGAWRVTVEARLAKSHPNSNPNPNANLT